MPTRHTHRFRTFVAATALLSTAASAQIVPSQESLSGLYAGRAYSPHAQRRFPNRLLWGDTNSRR